MGLLIPKNGDRVTTQPAARLGGVPVALQAPSIPPKPIYLYSEGVIKKSSAIS